MTPVKGMHSGRGPAVVVALVGGKLSSNKPLFDVVLNFDGWAIESGQSPDYGRLGDNPLGRKERFP
jgi:hypothetical protein